MKLSVYFTPLAVTPPVVAGKPVLVIDILRATTTMVTALANGARAILPAETADEAMRMAQNLKSDDLLLAGERNLGPRTRPATSSRRPVRLQLFTPLAVLAYAWTLTCFKGTPCRLTTILWLQRLLHTGTREKRH